MIELRIVSNEKSPKEPGDVWRGPESWDRDGRECWSIMLPNGHTWCTTQSAKDDAGVLKMWEVVGVPPKITVKPSINDQTPGEEWHGFIVEGRME